MIATAADVLNVRASWAMVERCVRTTVTSPPYWRQREYGAGRGHHD